jgi:hypothetical protein
MVTVIVRLLLGKIIGGGATQAVKANSRGLKTIP